MKEHWGDVALKVFEIIKSSDHGLWLNRANKCWGELPLKFRAKTLGSILALVHDVRFQSVTA